MIRIALLLLSSCLIFVGCQEPTDVQKPVAIIEMPVEDGIVTTEAGLNLVATLTDNSGILQYKITINGIDSLNGIAADSTLRLTIIEGLPEKPKSVALDRIIDLPSSTFNGHYQLTLACIDLEGNESFRDTVRFTIKNSIDSEPPVFNVTGVIEGDTLSLGDGISPGGMITDSQSLIFASVYIGRTNGSFKVIEFEFSNIEDNAVNFGNIGWYFQVDSTWAKGAYHMYYTAWDDYSGVSHSIPFHVNY